MLLYMGGGVVLGVFGVCFCLGVFLLFLFCFGGFLLLRLLYKVNVPTLKPAEKSPGPTASNTACQLSEKTHL